MDKNRARITIKLGQANELKSGTPLPKKQEKNAKEEKQEWIKSNEEIESRTEETEPEHLPEEDVEPLPAKSEISASKESADEFKSYGTKYASFEDEESFAGRRLGPSRLNSGREKNAKGLIGVLASVLGAVALGVVFGYIVLSFFKSGMLDNPATPPKPISETVETGSGQGTLQTKLQENAETGTLPGEAKITTVSITLPSSTYYMVQGGVFQDQASATPILEKIKSKGWPSSFSGEKPAYLFLGIAVNRDHALAIANHFQEMDVYIKEFKIEPKTILAGATTTQEEWDQWFKQEQLFATILGNAIGEGLTAGKLGGNQLKEITEAHRTLLQYGREWVNKLPESQQSLGNRLLNDYTKGVSAMERYQKQPEAGHLWQAEQALLDGFQSKTQLLSSFK